MTFSIRGIFRGLILTAFPILCGCQIGAGGALSPVPASAGVVERHERKDATVKVEADRIDAKVAGTSLAGEVKTSTDAQRAAVESAPARDIAGLAALFERVIAERDQRIAELSAELDKARMAALREQVRWLNGTGVALLVGFGLAVGFGGMVAARKAWPLLALAAGCWGLAQIVGHPWFVRGCLGVLVAGLGYGAWWAYQKHQDGKLRSSLEKKTIKLQGVLGEVVPVLDAAYEKAGESVRQILDASIFDRLSDAFTADQKAAIHEIRAVAKTIT